MLDELVERAVAENAHDARRAETAFETGWCVEGEDAAVIHDGNAVAQLMAIPCDAW